MPKPTTVTVEKKKIVRGTLYGIGTYKVNRRTAKALRRAGAVAPIPPPPVKEAPPEKEKKA